MRWVYHALGWVSGRGLAPPCDTAARREFPMPRPRPSDLLTGLWCLVVSAAWGGGLAAAPPPDLTVAAITLGPRATGPTLTAEALAHRVVLFVFWRRGCDECLAAMPMLEQTHRALGPSGLLVLGSHVERGTLSEVRQTVDKLGLTFPIVDDSKLAGYDVPTPPHALLFDHTGRCLAQGSPREMAAEAATVMRDAPPVVLQGRHLEKLAPLERLLKEEVKFGAALQKAGDLTSADDAATAEEATFVVERLRAHGAAMLAEADAARAADAHEAAAILQRAMTAFRGDAVAERAGELLREWRRDKRFTDGLQAASLSAQLEGLRLQALAAAAQPPTARGGVAPRSPSSPPRTASIGTVARVPPLIRQQMAQLAGLVRRLSPESRYASRAEAIAVEFSLDLPAAP